MKCWLHSWTVPETCNTRLPLKAMDPVRSTDPTYMFSDMSVTLYTQSCRRCAKKRAWAVTLDNHRFDLCPDDRLVAPHFSAAPRIFKACKWMRNGDHPRDDVWRPFEDTGCVPLEPREGAFVRYFRHPGIPGFRVCQICGNIMNLHGWIDSGGEGLPVCPGAWILDVDGRPEVCFKVTYEVAEKLNKARRAEEAQEPGLPPLPAPVAFMGSVVTDGTQVPKGANI